MITCVPSSDPILKKSIKPLTVNVHITYPFLLNKHRENMTSDMVECNPTEDREVDYQLQDFLPKTIKPLLQPLMEYRVKLMLKESTLFRQGHSQGVNTYDKEQDEKQT